MKKSFIIRYVVVALIMVVGFIAMRPITAKAQPSYYPFVYSASACEQELLSGVTQTIYRANGQVSNPTSVMVTVDCPLFSNGSNNGGISFTGWNAAVSAGIGAQMCSVSTGGTVTCGTWVSVGPTGVFTLGVDNSKWSPSGGNFLKIQMWPPAYGTNDIYNYTVYLSVQ